MKSVPLYDSLAADYDRFVNWDGRLSHELPSLIRLFDDHDVQSVLDAACGTGQHAIALAQRGYRVAGTDLSAAMIQKAEANAAAAGVDLVLDQAGLGELAVLGQAYDAVLCLGNSLPHLMTPDEVDSALADFSAVLEPGGLLLIQNRNFDLVWANQERFMSPQSFRDGENEWLFVRFYDFHEETLTFHMLRLRRTADGWTQDAESTELRPVFSEDLAARMARAGFGDIVFYGGYDGSVFDPARSGDLIATATKLG